MFLRAHGDYYQPIGEALPDLKELVTDAIGQPIRRVSRFMQLALIGAGRCARAAGVPRDTAVYLASSRGDLEITVDVLNQLFREGQAPKPLSFVNTVSNSAAFYIAKCLGLEAQSSFVSSRYFAFEAALQLALTDFQLGGVDSALIGCVDSAVLPLSTHRERLEVDASIPLAEASHWLWFTRDAGDSSARLLDVCNAESREQLVRWIAAQSLDKAKLILSRGQYVRATDFSAVQSQAGVKRTYDYRAARVFYASQSAAALSEFLRAELARTLIHVNSDSVGRYTALSFHVRDRA